MAQIGRQHAPRRERGRRRRDDHARDAELARDRDRVERPAAAVRDQRVVARIEPALGGDAADGERHLHVGEPHDARRRGVTRRGRAARPSFSSTARAAPGASSGIVPPRKREPSIRPSTTLASVTVGSVAAEPVADRARLGARALRPERERAARVDPRDGAAARADLLDVDHRDAERPAVHVVLVGGLDEPALDDRALRRRPAHVERDQPVEAERLREARAADGARGRPRLDRVHRLGARGLERERAAVRLRDEELARETRARPGPRRTRPR